MLLRYTLLIKSIGFPEISLYAVLWCAHVKPMEKVKLNNLETCTAIQVLCFGKLIHVRDLTTKYGRHFPRWLSLRVQKLTFFMFLPKSSSCTRKCLIRELNNLVSCTMLLRYTFSIQSIVFPEILL